VKGRSCRNGIRKGAVPFLQRSWWVNSVAGKRFPQDIQRSAIMFLPICFYLSEGRAVHFDRSGLWIAKEEQGRRMMTKGILIGCFGLMLTACAEDQERTGDRMQDRWQQMQKEVHDPDLPDKAEFEVEKEEITSELR